MLLRAADSARLSSRALGVLGFGVLGSYSLWQSCDLAVLRVCGLAREVLETSFDAVRTPDDQVQVHTHTHRHTHHGGVSHHGARGDLHIWHRD